MKRKMQLLLVLFFIIVLSISTQANIIPNKKDLSKPFNKEILGISITQTYYADNPACWLVIYNTNHVGSRRWAIWFQAERNIPSENMLGLDLPHDEHLPDTETATELIFNPVRDYLNSNPIIKRRIMGIIVGYRVPGNFGRPYMYSSIGGFSVANDLQYLTEDRSGTFGQVNNDLPYLTGNSIPTERLSKATMTQNQYMVARIDAPTLQDAKDITIRAKSIEKTPQFSGWIYYDYNDPVYTWEWLKHGVELPYLSFLPWKEFDADTEQTPCDTFRFGTHDVICWYNYRLFGTPVGPRVLAFNLNSFGASTVRSCTDGNGRYVPNALHAGYASAIGATGEPYVSSVPIVETLLASLCNGWTLGESFYLANPYSDWMWELHGDPFLQLNGNLLPPD